MRFFLRALGIGWLLAMAGPAEAQGVGLRVLTHEPGARASFVEPTPGGGAVRFGDVSRSGPEPRNGRRVNLPDGTTLLIATVVVEVTDGSARKVLPDDRPVGERFTGHRRGGGRTGLTGGSLREKPVGGGPIEHLGHRGALGLDPIGAAFGHTLTASLYDPTREVRAGVQGQVDWSQPGAGEPLGPFPARLAHGLRPGDRVRVDLALIVGPTDNGLLDVDVRLNLDHE